MSDAINNACAALREAASTLRDHARTEQAIDKAGDLAGRLEKALADLRSMASGDERFK